MLSVIYVWRGRCTFDLSMFVGGSRVFGLLLALGAAVGCGQDDAGTSEAAQQTAPSDLAGAIAPIPIIPNAEIGFIEVPAQKTAARYAARMFYSFRAASVEPHKKPLYVMFNGGPGAATSSGLLPFGTGPVTIDPEAPVDAPLRDNASSLTENANLLYIDERQTGFSYGLGGVPTEACAMSGFEDAADFVRVMLEFMRTHDGLAKNPVAIVGESYGGARAILMEHLLLYPTSPRATEIGISDVIKDHFVRTQLIDAANVATMGPDVAAKQFGHLVLIQPLVVGKLQLEHQNEYLAQNPDIPANFQNLSDVRKEADYDSKVLLPRLLKVLTSKEQSARLFGASLETIPQLRGDARKSAFRVLPRFIAPNIEAPLHASSETNFASWLGPLEEDDHYYHDLGGACPWTPSNIEPGNQFLQVLPFAKAFITNARYDALIYTPAIPEIMKTYAKLDVVVESTGGASARPGVISVGLTNGTRAKIRFPRYDSGHMVTVTQGAAFSADLTEFMSQ